MGHYDYEKMVFSYDIGFNSEIRITYPSKIKIKVPEFPIFPRALGAISPHFTTFAPHKYVTQTPYYSLGTLYRQKNRPAGYIGLYPPIWHEMHQFLYEVSHQKLPSVSR